MIGELTGQLGRVLKLEEQIADVIAVVGITHGRQYAG